MSDSSGAGAREGGDSVSSVREGQVGFVIVAKLPLPSKPDWGHKNTERLWLDTFQKKDALELDVVG